MEQAFIKQVEEFMARLFDERFKCLWSKALGLIERNTYFQSVPKPEAWVNVSKSDIWLCYGILHTPEGFFISHTFPSFISTPPDENSSFMVEPPPCPLPEPFPSIFYPLSLCVLSFPLRQNPLPLLESSTQWNRFCILLQLNHHFLP